LINARKESVLDHESKSLLLRAKQYYKLTRGIFDITVATLKPLFITQTSLSELNNHKERLLPYVGCEHFEIKKESIVFDNEFTTIDLGGFVKEYAVDRAAQLLKKKKVNAALINFGGDIFALGKKPNGERFRIGIKDPKNPSRHIEFIEIENQALTTSASYERHYIIEEKIFSHIISKQASENGAQSVSVVSSTCVESGVYSTALMIDSSLKHTNRTFIV
jgi:thiamine biosynthesis lipoprotein